MGHRTYVMGHWPVGPGPGPALKSAGQSYVLWPCPKSCGPVLWLMAMQTIAPPNVNSPPLSHVPCPLHVDMAVATALESNCFSPSRIGLRGQHSRPGDTDIARLHRSSR